MTSNASFGLAAATAAAALWVAVAGVAAAPLRAQTAAVAAPPATAQAQPAAAAGHPVLSVRLVRDAGGLPTKGSDKNLNIQFAAGLRKYLSAAGQNRFDVNETPTGGAAAARPPTPGSGRVLTVEGDLSRTDNGKGGGPFLAVVRLYQEKTGTAPRKLLAQWAGIADNYRYLTGNLDNRPDIDGQGLLGELGKRVAGVVAAPAASPGTPAAPLPPSSGFAALLNQAVQNKRVSTTLVPDVPAGAAPTPTTAATPLVLRAGQGYRLQIASQDDGAVYVVRDEGGGHFSPLFVPGENGELRYVAPDKPLLIPGSQSKAWVAPRTEKAMEQTLIVLVRRRSNGSDPAAATGANRLPSTVSEFHLAAFTAAATPDDDQAASPPPPVRVWGTVSVGAAAPAGDAPAEPGMSRLAQLLTSDPAGTWAAERLVVHIIPTGRGGTNGSGSTNGGSKPRLRETAPPSKAAPRQQDGSQSHKQKY